MMIGVSQRISVVRGIAVVTGGIAAIALTGLVAKFALETGFSWKCPALSVFGVPCPSCGSTRAFAALAQFNLSAAVKFNPLIILGVFAVPLLYFANAVPAHWKPFGWPVFGAAVLVNWLYLLLFLPR
jgi:hypothetical protein